MRRSTDTRTGISVVKTKERIDTFNIVGDRIHTIEWCYLQHRVLVHRWYGIVFEEEIKEVLAGHFTDAFLESKCTKILADLSNWTVSWDGVNEWLRDECMPRLYKGGLKRLAVIVPSESAGVVHDANRFAVERFATENPNIDPTFPTEQEALEWLKSAD